MPQSTHRKIFPHPGRIVRPQCIERLGLTVTAAARGLGVTRKALSELINGRSGILPEMALRLSKAFAAAPKYGLDFKWIMTSLGFGQSPTRSGCKNSLQPPNPTD
jgi:addiction module HigA family antidote